MFVKLFASGILLFTFSATASPANAGSFQNKMQCYFFTGETLSLQQTCVNEGGSWAGGALFTLTWNDGVTTKVRFGLQGARGEEGQACPKRNQVEVDGKCGEKYDRSIATLKRTKLSSDPTIVCVQLVKKSICWGNNATSP
jgi:hypothetical protein